MNTLTPRLFLFAAITLGIATTTRATLWQDLDQTLVEPDGSTAYVAFFSDDLNNDGNNEIIIVNADRSAYKIHTIAGNRLLPYNGSADQRIRQANDNNDWISLLYLTNVCQLDAGDPVANFPPLFAKPDYGANNYTAVRNIENPADYTCMIFKPHINSVRFTREVTKKYAIDSEDDPVDTTYPCFALTNPTMAKTMFRGYNTQEAVPVIVTEQFLKYRTPHQFSRWKAPESVRAMTPDEAEITCRHYGQGLRVLRSQWLATFNMPVCKRDYFEVILLGQRTLVRATVCLAEGNVAAAEQDIYHTDYDINTTNITLLDFYGGDYNDVFEEHLPEIMCIMSGDDGIELYLRYNSLEGTHYSVWREVGTSLVEVDSTYEYWIY